MKVKVTNGYGAEKGTTEQQKAFLEWFRGTLYEYGLPVESISSERLTGGPITLEVSDHLEVSEITRTFLAFATDLSQQATGEEGRETHVSFDLILPGCPEPVTILGTGY